MAGGGDWAPGDFGFSTTDDATPVQSIDQITVSASSRDDSTTPEYDFTPYYGAFEFPIDTIPLGDINAPMPPDAIYDDINQSRGGGSGGGGSSKSGGGGSQSRSPASNGASDLAKYLAGVLGTPLQRSRYSPVADRGGYYTTARGASNPGGAGSRYSATNSKAGGVVPPNLMAYAPIAIIGLLALYLVTRR